MLMKTPITDVCDILKELHRQRQDLHRAEKSMTQRIRAKCFRLCNGNRKESHVLYRAMFGKGGHAHTSVALVVSQPFIEARELLKKYRKETEKRMEVEVVRLPVFAWVESVRGMGAGSLAAIVGEAGNLSNYPTKKKLRMRLGLGVVDGERQQRKSDPSAAIKHGYKPSRRSVLWNVGEALIRAGGHYADLCRQRKEAEREKAEVAGLTVCHAAQIPESSAEQYRSLGHIHNRAKRHMEQQLINDLWEAWRQYT